MDRSWLGHVKISNHYNLIITLLIHHTGSFARSRFTKTPLKFRPFGILYIFWSVTLVQPLRDLKLFVRFSENLP